ncbi:unnamed protein product, partial [Brenthis ino]
MGKQQSKEVKEEITIAQNGAGNEAYATTKHTETIFRIELYLVFITLCILGIIGYFIWKNCKTNYGRYMLRELQDLAITPYRISDQGPNSPVTQQAIV